MGHSTILLPWGSWGNIALHPPCTTTETFWDRQKWWTLVLCSLAGESQSLSVPPKTPQQKLLITQPWERAAKGIKGSITCRGNECTGGKLGGNQRNCNTCAGLVQAELRGSNLCFHRELTWPSWNCCLPPTQAGNTNIFSVSKINKPGNDKLLMWQMRTHCRFQPPPHPNPVRDHPRSQIFPLICFW